MQVAIITKTGEQVEIVAVNGGWSTVHTLGADTREMKVRNGALSRHTEISDETRKIYESTWSIAKTTVAASRPVQTRKPIEERLNGVVYAGYLPQYNAYTTVRADGSRKRSIDKGDEVAQTLRTMELHSVYKLVARHLNMSSTALLDRFCHLNPGMQRMNLGNMLRKALRDQATKVAA